MEDLSIARKKAERYVLANGTIDDALIEIEIFIKHLERSYPTGYDYHSSRNYQSVVAIKTELEKLKYIGYKC
jgi:hypothetical protein